MSPFAHPKEETLQHPWKKAAALCLAALLTSSGLFSDGTSQALAGADWEGILNKLTRAFFHGVTGAVTTAAQVLSSVASAVVNGVVGLVFAIYLLAGKEKLQSQCTEAVILGALCAAASSESRG